MTTRRGFLGALAAFAAVPAATWADVGAPRYLAAAEAPDGSYRLYGLDGAGGETFHLTLPERGHAAAAHPTRPEAVAFARRPGVLAIVLDCRSGAETARLAAPEGRHFYGHGVFSADGATLFTTENDYEAGEGRIGLWSADEGYRRIGEIASGGVGPHDVKRLPGRDVLVVANGGIETHPDTGRVKLNLPTMRPNLAYLTPDGELVDRFGFDGAEHMNSIRHLALRPDGLVAFATQWQGEPAAPPLLGLHRPGEAPRFLRAQMEDHRRMEGYAGSVSFSGDGARVGVTSPRGGLVQIFDSASGAHLETVTLADACGLAPAEASFLVTSGTGWVGPLEDAAADAPSQQAAGQTPARAMRWDNHLVDLSAA